MQVELTLRLGTEDYNRLSEACTKSGYTFQTFMMILIATGLGQFERDGKFDVELAKQIVADKMVADG